jgi:hypothetical protein
MEFNERAVATDSYGVVVTRGGSLREEGVARGSYIFECRGPDGELKWREVAENKIMLEGVNTMLDAALAGSSYSVLGPFIGLISSVSFVVTSTNDTMAQLAGTNGWREAGNANAPTYNNHATGTPVRPTMAWSAASGGAKAMAAAVQYDITGTGTVEGGFVCYGTGAVSTIDNTGGHLWSGAVFSQGPKPVGNGDNIQVSYTTSIAST